MKTQIVTVFVAALLAGCATSLMTTPSGGPEVTINAPVAKVRARAINDMVNRGYTPTKTDSLNIIFEKDSTMMASAFFGSGYDLQARNRVKITLVDDGAGAVRVLCRGYIVSNPSSGFERENEITGSNKTFQEWLFTLHSECE